MVSAKSKSVLFLLFGIIAVIGLASQRVYAQEVNIDGGYLDTFNLTDGRVVDVGALGGGLDGQPTVHKTLVAKQANGVGPWPPNTLPSDGRLTGTIHGKFRVNGLTDRNSDGFINGQDLDAAFDVAWQLVGFDKNQGPGSAAFVQDSNPGPEGSVPPWGNPRTVNFPPTPGGTASTWNIAACDAGGFNPQSFTPALFCNQFAIPSPGPNAPFTGFVDYTFPVSIPGQNDFTPGLTVSNLNWILTALVGNTSDAIGGAIAYGRTPAFNPQLGVAESNTDLFAAAVLLNFPGSQANVPKANLLTTVQISVTPEPASGLLALLAGLGLTGSRRRRSL